MSIEMEMPKVLWLKNNMPKELFDRCKFYDLTDALEHIATGNEKRSFCSVVCKQGYVPVGVDGIGGVDKVVLPFLSFCSSLLTSPAERRISFCG